MTWADEMDSLAEAVEEGLGDSVTVRRVTPGAMNTTTMIRAKTTSDTTVSAVRHGSRADGDVRGAKVESVRYSIRSSRLSFRPDPGDQVIDTHTYTVTGCELSADGRFYEVTAERGLTSP